MLARDELDEAEDQVGKTRVCPKCPTVWRLEALDIRFKVTPASPTVVTAIPLWTPKLTNATPARHLGAVPDTFDNYDADSVADGVEQYANELANGARDASTLSKENCDGAVAERPVGRNPTSPNRLDSFSV